MSRKRIITIIAAAAIIIIAIPTVLAVSQRRGSEGASQAPPEVSAPVGEPASGADVTAAVLPPVTITEDDGVTVPLDFAAGGITPQGGAAAAAPSTGGSGQAEADEITGNVVLKASAPDSNGCFTLTLTAYNIYINVFQVNFSYDVNQVTPVDAEGASTDRFSKFASLNDDTAEWMTKIGSSLDTESGLVMCGAYMQPGMEAPYAGAEGIELYSFKMKRTGDGETGIKLATADSGGAYSNLYPDGAEFADAGHAIEVVFKTDLSALGEGEKDSEVTEPEPGEMTTEQRRAGTVILQIGNWAASVESKGRVIDPNNKEIVPFINSDDRTLVPVRFVAEALGAEVEWLESTWQVRIKKGGLEILMTVGSREYTVNGVLKTMDTESRIVHGWDRTVVPIRFVAEALGMNVEWDNDRRLVIISPPETPWRLGEAAEEAVTSEALAVISSPLRDFIGA